MPLNCNDYKVVEDMALTVDVKYVQLDDNRLLKGTDFRIQVGGVLVIHILFIV